MVHFVAREGTLEERTLRLKSHRKTRKLSVRVSGTLARVLSADLERLSRVGRNRFDLPVTIAVPAGGRARYVGTVKLKDRRGTVGRARVTVTTSRADATTIPAKAAAPTDDRITTTESGQPVVGDELVVGLSLDAADPEGIIRALAATHGAQIFGAVPGARTYQLRFPGATLADLERKRTAILGVGGVDFVSLNVVAKNPPAIPNDREWDSWDPDAPAGNNWGLERIGAPKAWDTTTGSNNVRIAVIDGDLDQNHGDLDDNVGRIDGRGPKSFEGHGTHVAGTICAEGNNKKGISGVAWDCDLRLFSYGGDAATTQEAMVKAVDDGARAVNMSLGFIDTNAPCGSEIREGTAELVSRTNAVFGRALLYAQRQRRDVLWVFAAGNECRDAKFQSPASLVAEFPTNVITVASIERDGSLSRFSDRGNLVTVAAPGREIFSTLPRTCIVGLICSDHYGDKSGTSMAAPHVTGLAARCLARASRLLTHRPHWPARGPSHCPRRLTSSSRSI
jgi:subtilisin family serine protease